MSPRFARAFTRSGRSVGGRVAWLGAFGAMALVGALVSLEATAPTQAWRRVDEPLFRSTQTNSYVNAVEPGEAPGAWLAGGYTVEPDGVRSPTVWSSPNGQAWEATALPVETSWRSSARVLGLARLDDVVVALGGVPGVEGDEEPVAWRLDVGGAWSVVAGGSGFTFGGPGVQTVGTLGSGPRGFFLVATEKNDDGNTLAVWHSADGASWRRTRTDEPAAPPDLVVADVAVGVAGAVFVGWATFDNGDFDGRTWFSDGFEWHQVLKPALLTGGRALVSTAAVLRDGFVVTAATMSGSLGEPETLVLVSDEGLEWTLAESSSLDPPDPELALVEAVASDGSQLYRVVRDRFGARLWSSVDAVTWTEEHLPDEMATVTDILTEPIQMGVSDGTVLVALPGLNQVAMWLREPGGRWSEVSSTSDAFPIPASIVELTDIAESNGVLAVLGNQSQITSTGSPVSKATFWWSEDGQSWTSGSVGDDPSLIELEALIADGSGFTAVGVALVDGDPRALLWQSADGRSWTSRELDPATSRGAAIVRGTDRTVVVGSVIEDGVVGAAAWMSKDGRSWNRTVLGGGNASGLCTNNGLWLVVGQDSQGAAAVWESEDGQLWRSATAPVEGGVLADCALSANGTAVVIGAGLLQEALVWSRSDGGWDLVDDIFALKGPPPTVYDIMATDGGFVVTGGESQSGQLDLGVWTSSDGRAWTRSVESGPLFYEVGLQEGRSIVVSGDNAFIVGHDGLGGGIWQGPKPTLGPR